MDRTHLIVVGGGALGLSTAWHAAKLGCHSVRVLERQHTASGSSGVSAGVVGTHYVSEDDIAMRAESLETFAELGEEVGFRRTGVVRLAMSAAEVAALELSAERQRDAGFSRTAVLDSAALAELIPDMRSDDLAGGLFMPQGGHVDGHLYCEAMRVRAEALGVEILVDHALLDAVVTPGGIELQTSRGSLRADVVVNAAGGWASGVGDILGVPAPVVPQRHEVLIARLPQDLPYTMPQVGAYFAHEDRVTGDGLYWRSETPRSFLVGEHAGLVDTDTADPDQYFRGCTAESIERVAAKLLNRLPGLSDMGLDAGWAGIYPMSPDERVLLGPWAADSRMIAACGAGGFGIQVAPAVGRVAAAWAVRGSVDDVAWAQPLLPDRPSVQTTMASQPAGR